MEAVRWARRIIHREMQLDYTKWHATEDYDFSLCNLSIPLALEGTFLPETDDIGRVDCGTCLGTRHLFAYREREKVMKRT